MEPPEIIEWLAGDECHALDEAGLAAGVGRRLRAAGLPLDWLSLHLRALHPEIVGRMHAWSAAGLSQYREREVGFDDFASLAGSPVRQVMERREWLRVRLVGNRGDDQWRPFFDILRRAGIAELLIAPLLMGSGPVSAAAFGTQRPDGFADAERAALERLLPSLRGACELRVLRKIEATLLDTYVGAGTGRHILAGHVRRGDIETLEAALLLCDMRGFTALSNRLSNRRVLELLNLYFDRVVPAINGSGGEVLKFMGDAVLAFFHADDPRQSCRNAFAAACAALAGLGQTAEPDAELRAGIALHHGEVAYGNIGSGHRLDFTLIGPDVNLTSRIETVCSATGHPLLMSERFARLLEPPGAVSVGAHLLKGFGEPVELFTAPVIGIIEVAGPGPRSGGTTAASPAVRPAAV